MSSWLKPRPLLVMVLLFVAPMAAIAHLLVTLAPHTLALRRLSGSVAPDAESLVSQLATLERIQSTTAELRSPGETTGARPGSQWLAKRDQFGISDTLAQALQADGVTVELLGFNDAGLYAATPDGHVLACEQITVECRGPYAGLTACLDRLMNLDLPIRIPQVAWQRGANEVELKMEIQIPFAPGEALEAILREAAGLEVDDEP